jgi:hypothetical protein
MSQDSPVAILYDQSGVPMPVTDGTATPASTSGVHLLVSDGTNSRFMRADSSGRDVVVGAGTERAPAGGVLSVQGVVGGTALTISGTSVNGSNIGTTGAAAPGSANLIGGTDGTNLQAEKIWDLDTGAGTDWNLGVSIRLPGSGGSTAGGTATNPIRTDPTGATTQPISAAALPLPTGAATEATLAGVLTTAAFQARINTLGQKTMANSTPVVLASDQSAIPVTIGSSTTGTRSDVATNAASTTILAANASRRGASIFNDAGSSRILYIKMGTTASTTDFTAKLFVGDYFEVPFGYTGKIDGIWSGAGTGAARVTEYT